MRLRGKKMETEEEADSSISSGDLVQECSSCTPFGLNQNHLKKILLLCLHTGRGDVETNYVEELMYQYKFVGSWRAALRGVLAKRETLHLTYFTSPIITARIDQLAGDECPRIPL